MRARVQGSPVLRGGTSGRLNNRHQTRGAPNALDLFHGVTQELVQLAGIAEGIAAAIAHLEAEAVDLERVGDFPGVGFGEQREQVLEEHFSGEVAAEELFLQRAAGPLGEDRALQVEHAFIHEGDGGKDGGLHGVAGVAKVARFLHGGLQGAAHLGAEALRLLHLLALEAHAQNGGEDFLKTKRKAVDPEVAHADGSTITVNSKTGCAISPGM